jgi:hypothetical protein
MFQFLRGIILATGIAATCGASFAAEDPFSANAVMPGCREAENYNSRIHYDRGLCMGIVSGVVSTLQTSTICAPPGVTNFQAIRVIVKYIDDRPEKLHQQFFALAIEALRAAWPCK